MFSAMISRPLLLLLAFILAFGAGWAIYELRLEETADAPPVATSGPAPERTAGEAGGAERPSEQGPGAPPDASTADQGSGEPGPAVASPADGPPATQRPKPEVERSQAQVEGSERALPAGPTPGELAQTEEPEAGGRVDPQAAPEPPADRDPAARASSDPSAEVGSAAITPAPESSEPSPPPEVEKKAAAAPPTTSTEHLASRPQPETSAAADTASATPDAAGASTAPPARSDADVPDEPAPATARVAETIRRAVAALFGGAMDEPAAGAEEAEVAAVPDATPGDPAPDRSTAGIEPGAAPSFDVVRVEPDGQAVIAGRAPPGAEVELRSGDRTIDRVRADQRGEWVALPPEPLGAGVQELTLAARVESQPAVASEEVVVVAVPESPPPRPAPEATAEPRAPQLAAAEPADEAFAVALPREGAGKGRILQAPGRISTGGALALVMLDYDDLGRIRLSGEADAGSALRIYVDNQPAGTTVVGPGGEWETVLEHTLTPGDYTLRLDQLDASGKPQARLETPFTRVSHPPIEGDVQVDYVIVQPGNSLWRIARRVLGEGMRYVHIYQANEGQIRDPDLIYPGQVFELPSGISAAG